MGKGEVKNCMEGSWDRLGALLARLGPIVGRFSYPGGGAWGGSRRLFLKHFLNVLAERQQKDNLAHMLMFISYIFLCYFLSPVAFLAA